MVEAIANGVEDFLIDGLSFKLKAGASYILNGDNQHSTPAEATSIGRNREPN